MSKQSSGGVARTVTPSSETALNLEEVFARIERRLTAGAWEERLAVQRAEEAARSGPAALPPDPDAVAEVATFALGLGGRRRAARRDGRLSRVVAHFALAATLALTGLAVGCDTPGQTEIAVDQLTSLPAAEGAITATRHAEPVRFTDLLFLGAGNPGDRWGLMVPASAPDPAKAVPIVVDREGTGIDTVGKVYTVPARTVPVETRDGPSQFLQLVAPAAEGSATYGGDAAALAKTVVGRWQSDERFVAAARVAADQERVLDAAYNAPADAAIGGTHTYRGGVVLRVDPDNPVLHVADRQLVESGAPLRPEDVVYVAVRPNEKVIYTPGQVVDLEQVAIEREQAEVEGQQETIYVVNAAVDGARVNPTGQINLEQILQQRLAHTEADLTQQAQVAAVPTPGAGQGATNVTRVHSGPSFLDDYLMLMWLTNSGWFRGPDRTISSPIPTSTRSRDYYYVPPAGPTARDAPAPPATERQATLQAARNAVSGQASGTGGGTAATAKSAAASTARVGAATNKAAAVAGQVSNATIARGGSSPSLARSSASSSSSRTSGGPSIGGGSKGFGGGGISSGSSS